MAEERSDAETIAGFLRDEPLAVSSVNAMIERAARPFRRRLASQWDDLLQDLRLEVLRLFQDGRFHGKSTLKTYLWQVVGHTCLDRIRAVRRWRWTDLEEADSEDVPRVGRAEHLPAWSPARDLLLRVLERMPQACRQIWKMVLAGLSYQEMSLRVGVSEGALRVRALRCRQQASRVRAELLEDRGNKTASPDASS